MPVNRGKVHKENRLRAVFVWTRSKQTALLAAGLERRSDVSLRTSEVCPAAPASL